MNIHISSILLLVFSISSCKSSSGSFSGGSNRDAKKTTNSFDSNQNNNGDDDADSPFSSKTRGPNQINPGVPVIQTSRNSRLTEGEICLLSSKFDQFRCQQINEDQCIQNAMKSLCLPSQLYDEVRSWLSTWASRPGGLQTQCSNRGHEPSRCSMPR